ncbi:hypothetical protein Y032_0025g1240 [Ancylostoma ceylanicum]|uniref:Uncharacterized protein n=1 Tax=Ancylostoma ceylanicum TaxID=53326 RepID=A0A016UUV2_9BILA|nr:hypothetical protein Y032_0025g1240 [Ancylostoma ceylanicum]
MIAVIGDQFTGDPCMLAHNCILTKSAKDKVERMIIKECRRIKEDKKYAGLSSRMAWQDVEDFIEECGNEDPEENDAMLHHFHRYGFAARQRTFRRAMMKLEDPKCTMDSIPLSLPSLPNPGHAHMGQQQGLWALVADGDLDLQPDATNKRGQLYAMHGVYSNTIDVPLLYAITALKTEMTCQLLFSQLKSELQHMGIPGDLRVVRDFEKASINAVRKVFQIPSVQGCGFHLAVCWNRKRDHFGLRKYLLAPQKDRQVCRWWDTIKKLIFCLHGYIGRMEADVPMESVDKNRPPIEVCPLSGTEEEFKECETT